MIFECLVLDQVTLAPGFVIQNQSIGDAQQFADFQLVSSYLGDIPSRTFFSVGVLTGSSGSARRTLRLERSPQTAMHPSRPSPTLLFPKVSSLQKCSASRSLLQIPATRPVCLIPCDSRIPPMHHNPRRSDHIRRHRFVSGTSIRLETWSCDRICHF